MDFQIGRLGDDIGKSAEQRSPAAKMNSVLDQVGGELGFGPLQCPNHALDNLADGLGQRFARFFA